MTSQALSSDTPVSSGKGLRAGLWTAQVLLALGFGMAAFMKLTVPLDVLVLKMPWVAQVGSLTRFIGLSEGLAALGMILPSATRIQPKLTGFAGIGLVVVMTLAAALHITRGEFGALPINFVLGSMAAFVAWGRLKKAPIAPR